LPLHFLSFPQKKSPRRLHHVLYPLTTILSVHHTPNPNLNGLDIPRKIAATILGLRDATCNRHRQYEPRIISTQSHVSTWNRRQSTDLITTLLVRKEKDSLHRRKQRICLLFSSSSFVSIRFAFSSDDSLRIYSTAAIFSVVVYSDHFSDFRNLKDRIT
jgi:hypothetical protein